MRLLLKLVAKKRSAENNQMFLCCQATMGILSGHSLLLINGTPDEQPRQSALVQPSTVSWSLSLASTQLFFRTRGILSHQNFSAHKSLQSELIY